MGGFYSRSLPPRERERCCLFQGNKMPSQPDFSCRLHLFPALERETKQRQRSSPRPFKIATGARSSRCIETTRPIAVAGTRVRAGGCPPIEIRHASQPC